MEHSELADTILLKKADNFRLASTEEEIVSNGVFFPKYHSNFYNKINSKSHYDGYIEIQHASTYYM